MRRNSRRRTGNGIVFNELRRIPEVSPSFTFGHIRGPTSSIFKYGRTVFHALPTPEFQITTRWPYHRFLQIFHVFCRSRLSREQPIAAGILGAMRLPEIMLKHLRSCSNKSGPLVGSEKDDPSRRRYRMPAFHGPHRNARARKGQVQSVAQQPRQIFFSRAFISASSALIESTRAAVSACGGGASAGFAAADDACFAAAGDAGCDAVLS